MTKQNGDKDKVPAEFTAYLMIAVGLILGIDLLNNVEDGLTWFGTYVTPYLAIGLIVAGVIIRCGVSLRNRR